jgi:hypothetical protein
VVLGSQKVELKEALYNAVKEKQRPETANPLVENGEKLIPSVTRVFRKDQTLFVYLQAYQQEATSAQPVVAYVSFYRGAKKVLETPPIEVSQGLENKLTTMPVRFSVPLKDLAAEDYECQVTVLNPGAQRAAFWRAPIVVIR